MQALPINNFKNFLFKTADNGKKEGWEIGLKSDRYTCGPKATSTSMAFYQIYFRGKSQSKDFLLARYK